MKRAFVQIAIVTVLLFTSHRPCLAQTANVTENDTKASLNISRNIVKLITALAKDYVDMKGAVLTKTDDGTTVYEVKDLDGMMAASEYIMIKSGGAAYYIASYTGDTKKLSMSFAAFTGGVMALSNGDGNFSITQDKEKSTGDKLVYIMSIKGTKVGSYSMEVKKNEGTMIIGFL